MTLDVAKYEGQIRAILQAPGVDLSTISAKRVRKQLVEQNTELTPELVKAHKEQLDVLIGSVYEEVSGDGGADDDDASKRTRDDGEDEVDEDDERPAPKKTKKKDQFYVRFQ